MPLISEAFHPGEYIKDEAEVRGWSIKQLAEKLGFDLSYITVVLDNKQTVSPELARQLGCVFGTSSAIWLNLQVRYELVKMNERKKGKEAKDQDGKS